MNKALIISYDNRVKALWLLVSIIVLSLFAYIYSINATARNIAERQTLERQVASISSNLSSLEFAHIELKNNVTLELAYEYGFREAENPLYVPRTTRNSLTFNTVER